MRNGQRIVGTPSLAAEIEAAGHWGVLVAVDADILRRLVTQLQKTPTAVPVYVMARLHVGPTSVSARDATLYQPEVQDRGGQLVMPDFTPVTERDRRQHQAAAPM